MDKSGDFFDRWTILVQKAKFDETAKRELEMVERELMEMIKSELCLMSGAKEGFPVGLLSVSFMRSLMRLAMANAKIWENEAAIRRQYVSDPSANQELSLVEIGRRALVIRDHNKERVAAKNEIDVMFGDMPDNKVDHASGGKP